MPANSADLEPGRRRRGRRSARSRGSSGRAAAARRQCAEPAGEARDQQARRLEQTLRRSNSSRPVGPPAVCAGQHRIGREQRREHDDVAEQEQPEAVGDDDRVEAGPPPPAPGTSSVGSALRTVASCSCAPLHAAEARVPSARSRAAETSISAIVAPAEHQRATKRARKPTIASHQMCQISAKPPIKAKKAMTTPTALLRGSCDRSSIRAAVGQASSCGALAGLLHAPVGVGRPRPRGSTAKFHGGGGEAVDHSSVRPFHGSPVRSRRRSRLRMLTYELHDLAARCRRG